MSQGLIARGGDGRSRPLGVGEVIHRGGGAGRICAVEGDPTSVVKLYHEPAQATHYKAKIVAMLARPPDIAAIEEGGRRYVQMAWPTAIAEDRSGRFLGFTMPFIDLSRADSLDTLLVKALRRQRGLPENYAYRLFAAQNVATMVAELHRMGHHVIDLKPQNLSVYKDNMYVAVVDCDGLSIDDGNGQRFPGHQFTDGYRCPEAVNDKLAPEQLGEEQDRFALAVVLFQLLNNGIHPFQGVPRRPGLNLGTEQERINARLYAYGERRNRVQGPSPASIHDTFEDSTRDLFRRAFERDHRPSAREWRDHLRQLIEGPAMVRCQRNPAEHAHFSKGCGLCRLDDKIRQRTAAARNQAPQTRRGAGGPAPRPRMPTPRPRQALAAKTRAAWAQWLRMSKRRLMGTPQAAPTAAPAGLVPMIFGYLVYGLFTANLVVIALIALSLFQPSDFIAFIRFLEAVELFPEVEIRSYREKLEWTQIAVVAALGASTLLSLLLASIIRGAAKGTLVESHATWIVRTFWLSFWGVLGGAVLATVTWPVGVAVPPLFYLWLAFRNAKGFSRLHRRQPIAAPRAII